MNIRNSMWNQSQCEEAYDEVMLKIAMSAYAQIHGEKLSLENERLKNNSEFVLKKDAEKVIDHILRRTRFIKETKFILSKTYRAASVFALVFLTIAISVTTTAFASEDFRNTLYKLLFSYDQGYTVISLDKSVSSGFVDSEIYTWEHAFAPTILPKYYSLDSVEEMTTFVKVAYISSNGNFLNFLQSKENEEIIINLETSEAEFVQRMFINDGDGLLTFRNGITTIVWRIGDIMFKIETNDDSNVALSVAKGIKILK